MKYHWIDYLVPFPSDRLDPPFFHSKMLIMNSNERFRQENVQLMKFEVFSFLLGIKKEIFLKQRLNEYLLRDRGIKNPTKVLWKNNYGF